MINRSLAVVAAALLLGSISSAQAGPATSNGDGDVSAPGEAPALGNATLGSDAAGATTGQTPSFGGADTSLGYSGSASTPQDPGADAATPGATLDEKVNK